MQRKCDEQRTSRYYPVRQQEKRKWIEEWSRNPAFYENPEWIMRIRRLAGILNVIGVIAFSAAVWGSVRTEALCYVLYPLVIWAFYLTFHRVLYWDVKTINPCKLKKQYVGMPLALGMMFSLRFIRACGGYAELAIPVFIIFVYCFIGMYYWNCALPAGEPEYVRAEIVDERKDEGTKLDSYYFTLRTEEGEERELSVSGDLYQGAGIGDSVRICRRISVFGIYCYYVELLGTG